MKHKTLVHFFDGMRVFDQAVQSGTSVLLDRLFTSMHLVPHSRQPERRAGVTRGRRRFSAKLIDNAGTPGNFWHCQCNRRNARRLKTLALPLLLMAAPAQVHAVAITANGAASAQAHAVAITANGTAPPPGEAGAMTAGLSFGTFVSNLDEAPESSGASGDFFATAFTTGNNAGGYTVTSAAIRLDANPGNNVRSVSIYGNKAGNLPGALLGTLAGPRGGKNGGVLTYTSSNGVPLSPATTYHLAVEAAGAIGITKSDDQASPDGWDITRSVTGISMTFFTDVALHFSITGYRGQMPFFQQATIDDRTWLAGDPVTPLTLPEPLGGANKTYTLAPPAPAGLSFTAATRVLSGTPSAAAAAANYTYTAAVAGGTASLTFRLAVVPANAATTGSIVSNLDTAHSLQATSQPLKGSPFTTGNNTDGYTVAGAVIGLNANTPAGSVHIHSQACCRSGDPYPGSRLGTLTRSAGASSADGVLTYTSSGGIALAPETTYYLLADIRGSFKGTSAAATSLDGWSIESALWSQNSKIGSFALHFSIAAFPGKMLTFNRRTIANQFWLVNIPLTPLTLPEALAGSGNKTYALTPALPSGLSFTADTRVIAGTPTTPTALATYTYTATDSAGATARLNFETRVLFPPVVPTAASIGGATGGFVTGAGQALSATVIPTSPPAGHVVLYQWYRGVAADGSSGTAITGSIATAYTTVNDDRGHRLGFGVRHRRLIDGVSSSETRAPPVSVRPTGSIFLSTDIRRGGRSVVPTYLQVGDLITNGPGGSIIDGFVRFGRYDRRLGSSGDWNAMPAAYLRRYSLQPSDVGYSIRHCGFFRANAPRVIDGEQVCGLLADGAPVRLSAPVNMSATAGDARVRLNWTAPDPSSLVHRYDVRHQPSGGTYTAWANTASTATAHTVTALINGTTYTFQVRAVTVRSTTSTTPGTASSEVRATPSVPPSAPAGLTATIGDRQVTLSWTSPAGTVTTYEYRRKTTGGYGEWTGTGASPQTVTGLTNCTTHTFQVRAVNGEVPGPVSQVTAIPLGAAPCTIGLRLRIFLEGPLQ